jgi:hypothetical protein
MQERQEVQQKVLPVVPSWLLPVVPSRLLPVVPGYYIQQLVATGSTLTSDPIGVRRARNPLG